MTTDQWHSHYIQWEAPSISAYLWRTKPPTVFYTSWGYYISASLSLLPHGQVKQHHVDSLLWSSRLCCRERSWRWCRSLQMPWFLQSQIAMVTGRCSFASMNPYLNWCCTMPGNTKAQPCHQSSLLFTPRISGTTLASTGVPWWFMMNSVGREVQESSRELCWVKRTTCSLS